MQKLITSGLALLLLLLATAHPAAAQEQCEPFVFTMQWTAQAQFAGYYVAQEKGFYKEAGLDVKLVHPTVTFSALSRILDETSDATCLTLPQAMELVDEGIEVVNIFQTSMSSALVLVSRHGVKPEELRGARVSTWRVGFGQIAECMSVEKGLNYEWIQAADQLNLFISGAVEASLAMSYCEYYQLMQTGLVESGDCVFRFSESGYDIQEDGVYMILDRYRKYPDRARRFAEASRKGWEWAAAHPEETLAIVHEYVKREKVATNPVLQKLMLDEVLRLQVAKDTGLREFRLRPEMVRAASDLMLRNGMIGKPIQAEDLLP